ncbi:MAG: TetR/AcrR family transcriptional regulator [Chloroflexota bacterium]|nr:TetR/AcrR family transcriptional regulator [Chloroflexota bacterium]
MSVVDIHPVNRFERRKQRTRDALKTATIALMQEIGYENTTIQKIADRADVGYGTFYLHYTDKDDAVWDVVVELMDAITAETNQRVLQAPAEMREYFGWLWLFEYLDPRRQEFGILFGAQGSAELRKRYQAYMTHTYERGMQAQVYSARIDLPIDFMAQFMAGATIQLLLWWMDHPAHYTPHDMAAMLYRMVYREELTSP